MRWITKRLAETASLVPSHVSLSITIFISSSSSQDVSELPGSSTPTTIEDVEKKAAADDESLSDLDEKFDRITVQYERLDLRKILETEVDASQGPVSVDG